MSNSQAIATATATLQAVLYENASRDVPGVNVTTKRPYAELNQDQPAEISIYLFQVTPNAAYRNNDLPTRRADGTLVQRPTAALDLHYMISFYGNEQTLEPQLLLGSVVRTLHAHPYLTRDKIRQTIQNNVGTLAGSDLDGQVELVKFSPLHLSLEEFSKIWSVFYEIPYVLSVAYQASLVLIEEESTTQAALPVLRRNLYALPFHQPVIEQVVAQANSAAGGSGSLLAPITIDSTLLIKGHNLQGGAGTLAQIDGVLIVPDAISDTVVSLSLKTASGIRMQDGANVALTDVLRAGVQGVQIIHRAQMGADQNGDELHWHRGVESNVAAFVLRPNIMDSAVNAGKLSITIKPVVYRSQRVAVMLNEYSAAARSGNAPPARAYSFVAKQAAQAWKDAAGKPVTDPTKADDTDNTDTITVALAGVAVGIYLLRVRVDGAESMLEVDANKTSPTFNRFIGPQVTIP